MLAWTPNSSDATGSERQFDSVAAGLLFRLTVAFPSWAGAILAVYSIFLGRSGALKTRLR
jgi:hypothetical protein